MARRLFEGKQVWFFADMTTGGHEYLSVTRAPTRPDSIQPRDLVVLGEMSPQEGLELAAALTSWASGLLP